MAYGRTKVGRLRAYVEPNGSFAVDGTGTMGNFADVRWMEADPATSIARLTDDRVRSYVWEKTLDVLGFRSLTFDVKGHLVSTGVASDAATTPTKDVLSKIFEALAGGYSAGVGGGGTGSLVASSSSPTGFVVTAAQGARMPAGSIVWVETGVASGLYQPAVVSTQTTDTLVFKTALSFTPAVGARVLNSQLIFPATIISGAETHLQWLYESEQRTGEMFLLKGCQGDLKLEWTLGQLIAWSTSQKGARWEKDASIAGTQGGSPLAASTLTGSQPIPASAGGIVFAPVSGTTRTLPGISKLTVSLGVNWTPVAAFNGTEGLTGFAPIPGDVTCELELPFLDQTYYTARDAGTMYRLLAQAGNAGGSQIALEMGNLQIVDVEPIRQNGLSYQKVTCNGLLDTCTDQSTDQRRAPWRIARG